MTDHKIGTREEWLAARPELLKAEKALTRRSDELAQWRQKLPWVRIDKEYRFDTDEGTASLADLFTLGQMSSKILKLLFLLHKADNKNNNKRLDYWVIYCGHSKGMGIIPPGPPLSPLLLIFMNGARFELPLLRYYRMVSPHLLQYL